MKKQKAPKWLVKAVKRKEARIDYGKKGSICGVANLIGKKGSKNMKKLHKWFMSQKGKKHEC